MRAAKCNLVETEVAEAREHFCLGLARKITPPGILVLGALGAAQQHHARAL